MRGMVFRAPSTAIRKNLFYKNLAYYALLPAPEKQSVTFSKAAQVPFVSMTQALKALGIWQAWEPRAWG